ncbi:UNVERIFIED_CONTAM: hypothetical protein RKD50_002860 [Streptomyces canus]
MCGRPDVDREGRRLPARPDRTAAVHGVSRTTPRARARRARAAALRAGRPAARRRTPPPRGCSGGRPERKGRTACGARPGERPSGDAGAEAGGRIPEGHVPGAARCRSGGRVQGRPRGRAARRCRRPGPARCRAHPVRQRARRTPPRPSRAARRAVSRGPGAAGAHDRRLPASAARRTAVRPRADDVQPMRRPRAAGLRWWAAVRARGRCGGASGAARADAAAREPCTQGCGSRPSRRRR